ncbi:MAG TPA: hypothetical protein VIL97_00230 [Thermoanaerobaculia bacterium]
MSRPHQNKSAAGDRQGGDAVGAGSNCDLPATTPTRAAASGLPSKRICTRSGPRRANG